MIQHTRDIEMIAVCTNTNHQLIVRHLIVVVGVESTGTVDYTSLCVQIAGVGEVKMMLVSKASIPATE